MTRIEWNADGTALYETGVDRGVFFPRVGPGVPWNGLVTVSEDPQGGEYTPYYFDGTKYYNFLAAEDFQATVEAYQAPAAFGPCDGSKMISPGLYATQQPRQRFNFAYRTLIGNELDDTLGYKVHLVYNITAGSSPRGYSTLSKTLAIPTRSWSFYTVPPASSTFKPTAHFIVDSREVPSPKLTALEDQIYGTAGTPPSMPTLAELIAHLD